MLATTNNQDDVCGGQQYAQIGFDRWIRPDNAYRFRFVWEWTQINSNCAPVGSFFGTATLGATYQFVADRFVTDGKVHLRYFLNGVEQFVPHNQQYFYPLTNYDPTQNHWVDPFDAQYAEEIQNSALDFAGNPTYRVLFSTVQWKNTSNHWQDAITRVCDPSCHANNGDGWTWKYKYSHDGGYDGFATCYAQQNDVTQNGTSWQEWTDPANHIC